MGMGIDEKNSSSDCYSAGERKVMFWTQKTRGWILKPLLIALAACGVTADILTVLALLSGLAFCPLFFISKPGALIALGVHLFFDLLDGPLARHTGTASRRGSLTDTLSDQIVVAATTATLIYAGLIDPISGVAYIFAYTVVIAFSMIRNALAIPYVWLFRPRFFVYVTIPIELYLRENTIDVVLWVFTSILFIEMISGYVRIRDRL